MARPQPGKSTRLGAPTTKSLFEYVSKLTALLRTIDSERIDRLEQVSPIRFVAIFAPYTRKSVYNRNSYIGRL
jgi:hypothetical protein